MNRVVSTFEKAPTIPNKQQRNQVKSPKHAKHLNRFSCTPGSRAVRKKLIQRGTKTRQIAMPSRHQTIEDFMRDTTCPSRFAAWNMYASQGHKASGKLRVFYQQTAPTRTRTKACNTKHTRRGGSWFVCQNNETNQLPLLRGRVMTVFI